jgi:hypothetical protein
MSLWNPGEVIEGLRINGRDIRAAVVNENAVRAAAGITMAVGVVAFAYAYFEHRWLPLKIVSSFFFAEFLLRVTVGFKYSPVGAVSKWLTKRQPPQWVSYKPKRFAWTLGTGMAGAVTAITNSNIHGWLPRSFCLACLTLMWLESVLGLCLGCELHGFLVRRGWATKDQAFEICANGACDVVPRGAPAGVGAVV